MTTAPTKTHSPHLLSAFDLRGLALRNRVVMAPLTRAPMFEQAFKKIDGDLWKDAGCTSELDYTEKGLGRDQLAEMQKIIDAEKSDLFDVLAHVAYALPSVAREVRAANAKVYINTRFNALLIASNGVPPQPGIDGSQTRKALGSLS